MVALGRGATIVYAEALIERLPANMVEVRPTVMVSVPRLYERVYARVLSAVESGPPSRAAHLPLGGGTGPRAYANHLAGRGDSLWLARAAADRRPARLPQDPRSAPAAGCATSSRARRPLAREIGEFFYAMGMLVLEGYGLTETSPFVSVNRPDDFVFGTVGRPAPGTRGA